MTPEDRDKIIKEIGEAARQSAGDMIEKLDLTELEKTWARATGMEAANYVTEKFLKQRPALMRLRAIAAALAYALAIEESTRRLTEAAGLYPR